jgi:hypothetical protein
MCLWERSATDQANLPPSDAGRKCEIIPSFSCFLHCADRSERQERRDFRRSYKGMGHRDLSRSYRSLIGCA